jgi:hypothetical protein
VDLNFSTIKESVCKTALAGVAMVELRKEDFLFLMPIFPPQSSSMQYSSSIGLMTPC